MPRLIDNAHAAAANLLLDRVLTDTEAIRSIDYGRRTPGGIGAARRARLVNRRLLGQIHGWRGGREVVHPIVVGKELRELVGYVAVGSQQLGAVGFLAALELLMKLDDGRFQPR